MQPITQSRRRGSSIKMPMLEQKIKPAATVLVIPEPNNPAGQERNEKYNPVTWVRNTMIEHANYIPETRKVIDTSIFSKKANAASAIEEVLNSDAKQTSMDEEWPGIYIKSSYVAGYKLDLPHPSTWEDGVDASTDRETLNNWTRFASERDIVKRTLQINDRTKRALWSVLTFDTRANDEFKRLKQIGRIDTPSFEWVLEKNNGSCRVIMHSEGNKKKRMRVDADGWLAYWCMGDLFRHLENHALTRRVTAHAIAFNSDFYKNGITNNQQGNKKSIPDTTKTLVKRVISGYNAGYRFITDKSNGPPKPSFRPRSGGVSLDIKPNKYNNVASIAKEVLTHRETQQDKRYRKNPENEPLGTEMSYCDCMAVFILGVLYMSTDKNPEDHSDLKLQIKERYFTLEKWKSLLTRNARGNNIALISFKDNELLWTNAMCWVAGSVMDGMHTNKKLDLVLTHLRIKKRFQTPALVNLWGYIKTREEPPNEVGGKSTKRFVPGGMMKILATTDNWIHTKSDMNEDPPSQMPTPTTSPWRVSGYPSSEKLKLIYKENIELLEAYRPLPSTTNADIQKRQERDEFSKRITRAVEENYARLEQVLERCDIQQPENRTNKNELLRVDDNVSSKWTSEIWDMVDESVIQKIPSVPSLSSFIIRSIVGYLPPRSLIGPMQSIYEKELRRVIPDHSVWESDGDW